MSILEFEKTGIPKIVGNLYRENGKAMVVCVRCV